MKRLISETIIPADLYVSRDADRQLAAVVKDMGRPGYVLVARQMGKTNLLLHAKRSLPSSDDCFAYVDLSKTFHSERECFRYIIDTAINSLSTADSMAVLDIMPIRSDDLPPFREYEKELKELAQLVRGKIVLILDEIDSLTRTSFSDTIFAQIRSLYFERINVPDFKRVTYLLSGVVDPNEIIKNKRISPFNIGQKILLDDFSLAEFDDFINRAALNLTTEAKDAIYHWTAGHPRMTWDICSLLEDRFQGGEFIDTKIVQEAVNSLYLIDFNTAPVDHIRELVSGDEEVRTAVSVLQSRGEGGEISSAVKNKLYLHGVIKAPRADRNLEIKNSIIQLALNQSWIDEVSSKTATLLKRAEDAFEDNKYAIAIELYEKFEKNGNVLPKVNALRKAQAIYLKGDFAAAAIAFENVKINASDAQITYRQRGLLLGSCYQRLQRYEESINLLSEVIGFERKDAAHVKSVFARGRTHLLNNVGDSSLAIQDFEDVILSAADENYEVPASDRNHLLAASHLFIGRALGDGRRAEQYKSFSKALEVAPTWMRPMILFELFSSSASSAQRAKHMREIISSIISEEILPAEESPEELGRLTVDALSNYLFESLSLDQNLFRQLYNYLVTSEKVSDEEISQLLFSASISALNRGEKRVAGELCHILINEQSVIASEIKSQAYPILLICREELPNLNVLTDYKRFLLQQGGGKAFQRLDISAMVSILANSIATNQYDLASEWSSFIHSEEPRIAPDLIASLAIVYSWELTMLEKQHPGKQSRNAAEHLLGFIEKHRTGQENSKTSAEAAEIERVKAYAVKILGYSMDGVKQDNLQIHRNDRVTVRYQDGRVVKDIKYKKAYKDLTNGNCTLSDD